MLSRLRAAMRANRAFGPQDTFKIKTKNGERNMSFNQTSVNYLIDAYGEDTDKWVNKNVKVWIVDMNVQGKMRGVAFLTAPDWKKTRINGELKFVPTNPQTTVYPEGGNPDAIDEAFNNPPDSSYDEA